MDPISTHPASGSPSAYAGVGSRRTPAPVLAAMRDLAESLGDLGWALSTGGADGARRRMRPASRGRLSLKSM